jgi:hypothetical protein
MDSDKMLSTTRSVRMKLDLDRPVEHEVIDVFDAAPSGADFARPTGSTDRPDVGVQLGIATQLCEDAVRRVQKGQGRGCPQ